MVVVSWGILSRNSPQILCQERNGNLHSFSFPLKPMFSSPSPTKVIIIIASGREPVTRHYSKVESHPVSQLLADEEESISSRNFKHLSISNLDYQRSRIQAFLPIHLKVVLFLIRTLRQSVFLTYSPTCLKRL